MRSEWLAEPKGHWKLAGGANHRFIAKIESEPQPGRRKSRGVIPSPLPGLGAFGVHNRWFAPPANFHDASGVQLPDYGVAGDADNTDGRKGRSNRKGENFRFVKSGGTRLPG